VDKYPRAAVVVAWASGSSGGRHGRGWSGAVADGCCLHGSRCKCCRLRGSQRGWILAMWQPTQMTGCRAAARWAAQTYRDGDVDRVEGWGSDIFTDWGWTKSRERVNNFPRSFCTCLSLLGGPVTLGPRVSLSSEEHAHVQLIWGNTRNLRQGKFSSFHSCGRAGLFSFGWRPGSTAYIAIATNGLSSLLIYPDPLFDGTVNYLYQPIIHRDRYIFWHLVCGQSITTNYLTVLVNL